MFLKNFSELRIFPVKRTKRNLKVRRIDWKKEIRDLYYLLQEQGHPYPWLTSIDHPEALIGHLQDAALRGGRLLRGIAQNPSYRLANHSRAFMRQGLHRAQVTQQVSLLFHLGRARVEVAVVHVDRISRWKDALSARPQIHAW